MKTLVRTLGLMTVTTVLAAGMVLAAEAPKAGGAMGGKMAPKSTHMAKKGTKKGHKKGGKKGKMSKKGAASSKGKMGAAKKGMEKK